MLTGTSSERGPSRIPLPALVEVALERGAAILTANQRSARSLRLAYAHRMREQGRPTWTPPIILSWSAWTSSLWQRLLIDGEEDRLLLSQPQEHAVWTSVIDADKDLASLQRPDALAELAQRSWRSLAACLGLGRLRECVGSLDAETFARWALEFDRRCKRERWLSLSEIEDALTRAIASGSLMLAETEFVLIGFDRITPAQAGLCDAMRAAGLLCDHLALRSESEPSEPLEIRGELAPQAELATMTEKRAHRRSIVTAKDTEEEVYAAAWIARGLMEADPQARVAVILPDVASRRDQLERAFRHVLAPELDGIAAASIAPPFEFSLGKPLARLPMTTTALSLLRWAIQPLRYNVVSHLLLSPHLGNRMGNRVENRAGRRVGNGAGDDADELSARAALDERLRRRGNLLQPEVSLEWLIEVVEAGPQLAALRQSLTAALRVAREAGLQRASSTMKTHTEWSAFVHEYLTAMGWPGARALDSTEFQLLNRWNSLLDQLCILDFADLEAAGSINGGRGDGKQRPPRVTCASALDALERLARETLFAPESHSAPVQIMGVLEAAGSVFNAVLLLGATDAAWPPAGQTAPFLPWQLQRSLGMPNTDPAVEQKHSVNVTRRMVASAPLVFFSYAKRDGKLEFRPSPLLSELGSSDLRGLGSSDLGDLAPSNFIDFEPSSSSSFNVGLISAEACIRLDRRRLERAVDLEEFDGGGIIVPPPDTLLRGGANLLKLQALCPFRAFAEQRLGSSELAVVEPGLNAMQRGSVVHSALKMFWDDVKTQEKLKQMRPDELRTMLDVVAKAAIEEEHQAKTLWERTYLDLQRRWLAALLDRWMEVELARPPFEVHSTEDARSNVQVGKLRLNLRLDRVDAVEGGLVYLDYKTGDCSRKDWEGERPDEPQLPLYATQCDPAMLAGLAFAKVSAGEMCLSGYAIGPGILKPARFKQNGEPCSAAEVLEDLTGQVNEWKRVIESLADEFHRGVATVTPKEYPKTCKHCGQRAFCRVSESRLALEMDADDEDRDTSSAGRDGSARGEEASA